MGRVDGKVAFVTGAARGLGRSHAVRLAEEGADIIAIDVPAGTQIPSVTYPLATAEDMVETARLVTAAGRRIVTREADVRDSAALAAAAADGAAELGRIDIVIANAGVGTGSAPVLELSEQSWQNMIDINLTGVWRTLRAAVPHVLDGGRGGSVVIVSSVASTQVNENIAHYSAAKAGLVALMKVAAKELGPYDIRVNSVHPGTTATDMVLNERTFRLFRPDLDAPTRADFEEAAGPLTRLPVALLEPIDISETVLHLVADSGRYITGTTHVVDAGGLL
jgi:SDR family mycofactocin-dependent oxidoreductase